jgi:hypothetical protein
MKKLFILFILFPLLTMNLYADTKETNVSKTESSSIYINRK